MDPITLALATFGIQKLRGKSTKRSFRDALIVGGIGQLGSMTQAGQGMGLSGFGTGAGQLGAGGLGIKQQLANTQAAQWASSAWGQPAVAKTATTPAVPATGIQGWSPGMKIGAGLGLATLMEGDEDMPDPPFTEQDYKDAYNKQSKLTSGLGEAAQYSTSAPFYYGQSAPGTDLYSYKEGGLASLPIQKFATGGVSYLPSKIDHDEKDTNNYIRAHGQIADGTGSGDKNEDTILAQLADGEFVSRSDAILGAGLIEGAAPNSEEEMRKKGAAFFYGQQSKFKRIFDLLNASKKTKH
jgi:hypothetical protein